MLAQGTSHIVTLLCTFVKGRALLLHQKLMSENVVLTEQKASYVGVDTVSVTYSEIGTGTTLSPSISPSTATSAQPAPSAGLHQKDFDVLRLLDFFCEITGLDKTQVNL